MDYDEPNDKEGVGMGKVVLIVVCGFVGIGCFWLKRWLLADPNNRRKCCNLLRCSKEPAVIDTTPATNQESDAKESKA